MPIHIDPSDPVFAIGIASRLTGLSPKQLRLLEEKAVIVPFRSDHSRRLYSLDQLNLLKYVAYLVAVRRSNVGGISAALELLARLPEEERSKAMEEAEGALGEAKASDLPHFEESAALLDSDGTGTC